MVIPSGVTVEVDLIVMSLICNVCKPAFPRIIIKIYQDLLSLNYIQTIDVCFHIVYKIKENVLQIHATRVKAIVVSKITNSIFCRKKKQIINENIKK